jgi:hypothetical protein
VQSVGVGHDTALRVEAIEVAELAVRWMVQRLPFQRSANGPPGSMPIAVQAVADAHDTPDRMLPDRPGGLGVR